MAESWSIEEEKQLQALMAKKVVVQNESRGAAMSDGSKRRYVDEESVGSMDNPWIEVSEKEPPQGWTTPVWSWICQWALPAWSNGAARSFPLASMPKPM